MARAWCMSTASGFSIITGMWRGAHAATTLTCEKVSVKVATASGFAVSSMLSRSVKSRSLPRWFDEAHFASSAASGSQTATMTTSAGRLCAFFRNPQTWPWFSPAMAMRNGFTSGGCAAADVVAMAEAKSASGNRRFMAMSASYRGYAGWYTQSGRPSTVDHFITGAAIAPGTKGAKAHLALAYYYYPVSACANNCSLYAGFIQTTSAGKTWSAPETLAGPMQLTWLPQTFSGTMVADYISVEFAAGKAFPVFAAAQKKTGSLFHEAIYTTSAGQEIPTLESEVMSAEGDQPVPNAHSDRGPMEYLDQEHLIPIPPKNPPKPN